MALAALAAVSCLGAPVRLADCAVVWNPDTGLTAAGRARCAAALADFTNMMSKVTGNVPVVYVEGREPQSLDSAVYLGRTKAAAAAGCSPEGLRRGDWRIRSGPGRVFVYAVSGMGLDYAVADFAERFCGYHYLTPEGDDPFDFDPSLEIPATDSTVKPAIYNASVFTAVGGAWNRWASRRRLMPTDEMEGSHRESYEVRDADGKTRTCHTSFCYLPPEKFFKEHSEYYSLIDGRRQCRPTGQLCMTNPEVRRLCLERLLAFIAEDRRKHPGNYPLVYDFTQQDDIGKMCECPECRKAIARYTRGAMEGRRENYNGGDAGLQLEFINWIADEAAKKYPDVLVRTFAYVSTEIPPRPGTIRPSPNVMIWWCDLYGNSEHLRPLASGPFNFKQAGILKEWLGLARQVQVWDYMLYGSSYSGDFPEFSPDAISADAKFFAEHGLDDLFMESERKGVMPPPFYELNYYLMSRLYTDPNADVDALIRTYCRVYGKGAGKMFEALRFLRRLEAENPAQTPREWHQRVLPWRTRENWERFRLIVKSAYDAEGPGPARARIARAMASVSRELVRIYGQIPSATAELASAKGDYLAYGREYATTTNMPENERKKMLEGIQTEFELLSLRFNDLPAEVADASADEIRCADYHRFSGAVNGRLVEDAESETGRAKVWKLGKSDAEHRGFPVPCGMYDDRTKMNCTFSITSDMAGADEKYHWIRLGKGWIGSEGLFWIPGDWHMSFRFGDWYIQRDGLAVDPNWYDVYLSVKFTGPAYVPGSTRPNGIWIDRLVLRRTAPPGGGEEAAALPDTRDEGLFPFTFTTPAHHTVADFSDWFAAPAGADGFVRAKGEKFATDAGEIFLNGVNLTGAACFPTHDEAEALAVRLARLGFNAVRLHYVDSTGLVNFRFKSPVGLLDPKGSTGMELRPEMLDRYDYLVYALEKNGVYVDINLRVGMTLDGRLGFPEGPSLNRGVCAIDPRLLECEKRYAKKLLTHVNPYTQRSYVDDPGVAIVEIRNESALPAHWASGLVDDLKEPWRSQFRRAWNDFRRAEGAMDEIDVLAAKKPGPAFPESVTNQFVRFLFDLDEKYWRAMARYLKDDLGVKCVVVGTLLGYSTPYMHTRDCGLDAVDEHLYWSHPDGTGEDGWLCVQTAEVNFPEDAFYKATQRIAGKPFLMTETSEPFPSLYSSEHFPLVHAYGAFQGWAGIFAYTWNHSTNATPDAAEYFFSHAGRVDTQAHFPACAAITRGRAVRESTRRVVVPAPEGKYVEQVVRRRRLTLLANEALGTDKMPLWNENIRHGIAVDLTGTASAPTVEPVPADNVWRADTGELVWDSSRPRESFVTCDTKSVKFFTGFAKDGKRVDFKDATLEIGKTRLGFATVTMLSRDRGGFGADGKPARILVAATGLVKNSGQEFTRVPGLKGAWHDPDGLWTTMRGDKWGHGPQLCEGVSATLTLNVPVSRVRCWALDGAGVRKGVVPVAADVGGRARIALGNSYRTVWYEVSVVEAAKNPDTDWMIGKLGVFLHWWPTAENPDAARDFDVEGLVRDLKEIKPDFFFFTLGQNSGYYNAPNETYEQYAGFEKGSRCGRGRDLPAEIIAALKGSGIRMGLYAPCQPAFDEPAVEAKFGNLARAEDKNYYMTDAGVDRWADVVRTWSRRYGEDVAIWWFDGGLRHMGMTDAKAARLAAAARAGNGQALVTFNSGLLTGSTQVVNTASCDYTSGEVTRGPSVPCRSRTVDGAQWFALTHFGSYWTRSDFNLPDKSVRRWLGDVVTHGGAAAIDMGRDARTGRLDAEQKRRLARIFAAARTLREDEVGRR